MYIEWDVIVGWKLLLKPALLAKSIGNSIGMQAARSPTLNQCWDLNCIGIFGIQLGVREPNALRKLLTHQHRSSLYEYVPTSPFLPHSFLGNVGTFSSPDMTWYHRATMKLNYMNYELSVMYVNQAKCKLFMAWEKDNSTPLVFKISRYTWLCWTGTRVSNVSGWCFFFVRLDSSLF